MPSPRLPALLPSKPPQFLGGLVFLGRTIFLAGCDPDNRLGELVYVLATLA